MNSKYFVDKREALLLLIKITGLAIVGLMLLWLINYALSFFTDYIIVPHILLVPAFFGLIYIYRFCWLLFLPIVKIDVNKGVISYFNMLWYNNHLFENIGSIVHFTTKKSIVICSLNNVKLDEISSSELNENDMSNIMHDLASNTTLKLITVE